MTGMHALWLPILLSAVFVFIMSSIIHMLSPWHKGDYPRIPHEDEVRAALAPLAIPPGDYMVPRPAQRADMKSPEYLAKLEEGPVLVVTVMRNGMMNMGKNMGMWFVYLLVVGTFAAFVTGRALPPGASADRVRLFAGLSAFMSYALGLWQMSIWYQRSLSNTMKATVDAVIYGAITAFTFSWLWPS